MKGYAEQKVFTERELWLLKEAEQLVAELPTFDPRTKPEDEKWVRCHELARAVGRMLRLQVRDGRYGWVDHSWLWLGPWPVVPELPMLDLPHVLDVYVPGSLPQVQLVDMASGLPPRYYPSPTPRTDIDDELVRILLSGAHASL